MMHVRTPADDAASAAMDGYPARARLLRLLALAQSRGDRLAVLALKCRLYSPGDLRAAAIVQYRVGEFAY